MTYSAVILHFSIRITNKYLSNNKKDVNNLDYFKSSATILPKCRYFFCKQKSPWSEPWASQCITGFSRLEKSTVCRDLWGWNTPDALFCLCIHRRNLKFHKHLIGFLFSFRSKCIPTHIFLWQCPNWHSHYSFARKKRKKKKKVRSVDFFFLTCFLKGAELDELLHSLLVYLMCEIKIRGSTKVSIFVTPVVTGADVFQGWCLCIINRIHKTWTIVRSFNAGMFSTVNRIALPLKFCCHSFL